jgi:hypothetical protein
MGTGRHTCDVIWPASISWCLARRHSAACVLGSCLHAPLGVVDWLRACASGLHARADACSSPLVTIPRLTHRHSPHTHTSSQRHPCLFLCSCMRARTRRHGRLRTSTISHACMAQLVLFSSDALHTKLDTYSNSIAVLACYP